MNHKRLSLWSPDQQDAYVSERDTALKQRAERREGIHTANKIDTVWSSLDNNEKLFVRFLLYSGVRSCIARCDDDLMSSLVEKGILVWPQGVRPVITDDLMIPFTVPPAVWSALIVRLEQFSAGLPDRAEVFRLAEEKFGKIITLEENVMDS